MLYEWILDLTGILVGTGYSQNSNVQLTACLIVLMVVFFLLFWINHLILYIFHVHKR